MQGNGCGDFVSVIFFVNAALITSVYVAFSLQVMTGIAVALCCICNISLNDQGTLRSMQMPFVVVWCLIFFFHSLRITSQITGGKKQSEERMVLLPSERICLVIQATDWRLARRCTRILPSQIHGKSMVASRKSYNSWRFGPEPNTSHLLAAPLSSRPTYLSQQIYRARRYQ